MPSASTLAWVALFKDFFSGVAAVFAAMAFFIAFLKLRVEHPGYKLVLERELALFAAVEELAAELQPLLTHSVKSVDFATDDIRELRGRIKRLAASVYASDELRSSLYLMSDLLREGAASKSDLYSIRADIAVARWRECTNAMRFRVSTLASSDKPFRLYTFDVRTGRFAFVDVFATRRARQAYKTAHPLSDPAIQYQHWAKDKEHVGLISRYLDR